MNLTDLFRIHWHARASKRAIVFQDRHLTFCELDLQSERIAAALLDLGLRKGDRVALYLQNSLELILTYLANLKLGLVTVPMNTQYRDMEISHILSDATPRLILADRAQLPILAPVLSHTSVEHVLVSDEIAMLITQATLTGQAAAQARAPVDGDDLAVIMYTSGTTGRSKGAMLTHNNLISNITGLVSAWGWTVDDRLLLALPLFHMHGLGVALNGILTTGCEAVLHASFHAGNALDELMNGEISLFMGVPTMYVRLLQEAQQRGHRAVRLPHMRLFVSGSAPLSVETFLAFERTFGHAILERYGMTETAMNLSNLYAGPRLPGTIGVPLPGVSARIGDEAGNPIGDGEIGEILLRGPNIFRGYWQAPEKTAQAFVTDAEGSRWFRTGDLGRRDSKNGYYTLVGRKHDLIISGGYNIYPREVEEMLASHPAVLEAAVVGSTDPALGEVPVAFVVRRAGVTAEGQQILDFCSEHLAHFKVPRRLTFVDALPRNAMGKIEKNRLG